ncbi:scavenger receptor cysteine-rich type 1 protein M130-like [Heterodontus francisci]|uniref:scavenger receptor cysteine-rich type 1 protein M130-like n=1 Tax=Heterodontus francisci TaxID=7792 RepID=UPI00355BC7A8
MIYKLLGSGFVSNTGKYGPRLVDEMNRCSGRVEVLHGDLWWTLCDLYFDMEDAKVVCEHLQCGAVNSIPRRAHFGKGTGPVWKENYRCRGNETRLWDCPVSSWEQFSCSHENDASVICTDENWSLRLTNGASHCDGRVEIYCTGSWGRLQDRHWTLNDANVVCTKLGCGEATASYNYSKDGKSEGPVWVNDVQCEGNELQLQNCSLFTLNSSLTDSVDVGVLCAGEQILHRFYKNIKVKCLICSEKCSNTGLLLNQKVYTSGVQSTKTPLTKITNDLLSDCNKYNRCLLLILDLHTAFDMSDHEILLQALSINTRLVPVLSTRS